MRDYRQIPCDLQVLPKDKRDYTLEMFKLSEDKLYPKEYVVPFNTPILDQGNSSMCLDFTYRSIEEEQYVAKTGEYKEFANGFMYGQKIFSHMEGMIEKFDVISYVKKGIPFAEDFNIVGTALECEAYFKTNATKEVKKKAELHRNRSYLSVTTPEEVIKGLVEFGTSGYIGVMVYNNFYDSKVGGMVPMPSGKEIGGHAMKLKGVKFINGKQHYVVQNSWGEGFGDNGFVYIDCENPCILNMRLFTDATPENEIIELSIGDKTVVTLKENIELDIAPFIVNGNRTVVPLRFISEVLGYDVEWAKGGGTKKQGLVTISKKVSRSDDLYIKSKQ